MTFEEAINSEHGAHWCEGRKAWVPYHRLLCSNCPVWPRGAAGAGDAVDPHLRRVELTADHARENEID